MVGVDHRRDDSEVRAASIEKYEASSWICSFRSRAIGSREK